MISNFLLDLTAGSSFRRKSASAKSSCSEAEPIVKPPKEKKESVSSQLEVLLFLILKPAWYTGTLVQSYFSSLHQGESIEYFLFLQETDVKKQCPVGVLSSQSTYRTLIIFREENRLKDGSSRGPPVLPGVQACPEKGEHPEVSKSFHFK